MNDEIKRIRYMTRVFSIMLPLIFIGFLFSGYHLVNYFMIIDHFDGQVPSRSFDAFSTSMLIGCMGVPGSIFLFLVYAGVYYFKYEPSASKYTKEEIWGSNSETQPIQVNTKPQMFTENIEQEIANAQSMLNNGLIDEQEFKLIKTRIISGTSSKP